MRYVPVLKNNDSIRLGPYTIDVKMIRCLSTPDEISGYWKQLETQGFPLDDITSTLAALEAQHYIKHKEYSALPLPIHALRLVDAVRACLPVRNFELRKNNLKERLIGIKENKEIPVNADGTIDPRPYRKYVQELLVALISSISEFRIVYALKEIDSTLEFTASQKDMKYPDLRILQHKTTITEPSSLAEVKSRLNRSYTGEEITSMSSNSKLIQVDEKELLILLCRDAFPTFSGSFDEQMADISIVDLTHSEYGDIFAACSRHLAGKFDPASAVQKALKMADLNQEVAILYTEVFTLNPQNSPPIAAIAVSRDYVEETGRKLDKIEKEYYKNNREHLDYFGLINEAKKLSDRT